MMTLNEYFKQQRQAEEADLEGEAAALGISTEELRWARIKAERQQHMEAQQQEAAARQAQSAAAAQDSPQARVKRMLEQQAADRQAAAERAKAEQQQRDELRRLGWI
jgi:hypothetical protein